MNMRKTLLCGMCALLMLSCAKNGDDASAVLTHSAIKINTSIVSSNDTRVHVDESGSEVFDEDDAIGVFVTKSDGTAIKSNIDYSDTFYWDDLNSSTLRFSAYYPKRNAVASAASFEFTPEASVTPTAADTLGNDLLVAASSVLTFDPTKENTEVSLNFKHAMHKVVVSLSSVSGDYTEAQLQTATVGIKATPSATVDLINATVIKASAATAFVAPIYKSGTKSWFIVSPQSIDAAADFVEISILNTATNKNNVYTYKFDAALMASGGILANGLEQGKVLYINLSIEKSGITVTGTEIKDWVQVNIDGGNPTLE